MKGNSAACVRYVLVYRIPFFLYVKVCIILVVCCCCCCGGGGGGGSHCTIGVHILCITRLAE